MSEQGYWYCPTCVTRIATSEHTRCGKPAIWIDTDGVCDLPLREAFAQMGLVVEELRRQVFALQCSVAILEEQLAKETKGGWDERNDVEMQDM